MKRIPAPKVIKRENVERIVCIPQSKIKGDK